MNNKHAIQSSRTREKLVCIAEELYAQRGVDAVSLNEIATRAGQKNRNAMQYHFGNKDGVLQAIIDKHSEVIYRMRSEFIEQARVSQWSPAELAARVFVMPIANYIETNAGAIYYVKILSQMVSVNMPAIYGFESSAINLRMDKAHREITEAALQHLNADEARRRIFLSVGMVFHSLADICSAQVLANPSGFLSDRQQMFEQVVCSLAAYYQAPAVRQ